MKIDKLPGFVAQRLLQIEHDARDAQTAARDAADALAHARRQLSASSIEVCERIQAEMPTLLEQAKKTASKSEHLTHVIEVCRGWIRGLPDDAVLRDVIPNEIEPDIAADPDAAIDARRKELKKLKAERDALRLVQEPSKDIEQRVRDHVAKLAGRPIVKGVAEGAQLKIFWPGAKMTAGGYDERSCDALQMFAALVPEQLVKLAMQEITREANRKGSRKQREERMERLHADIHGLESKIGDIVRYICKTGRYRGFGTLPADAVLGIYEENPDIRSLKAVC